MLLDHQMTTKELDHVQIIEKLSGAKDVQCIGLLEEEEGGGHKFC